MKRGGVVLALAIAGLAADGLAHESPTPAATSSSGGLLIWSQDKNLPYEWDGTATPPAWLKPVVTATSDKSNSSRRSRSPELQFKAGAKSVVRYGAFTGGDCDAPTNIACAHRELSSNFFRVTLRANKTVFDWGTLEWCESNNYVGSCLLAHRVLIHEFGHVLGLGHHVSGSSEAAFTVMQPVTPSSTAAGGKTQTYEPCDVATLQREYDALSDTTKISTCLSAGTTLALTAQATSVPKGGPVGLTATLRVSGSKSNKKLALNKLSGRAVYLEGRKVGTTAFAKVANMAPAASAGQYVATVFVPHDSEYRARFEQPSNEGLGPSHSTLVEVGVDDSLPPYDGGLDGSSGSGGAAGAGGAGGLAGAAGAPPIGGAAGDSGAAGVSGAAGAGAAAGAGGALVGGAAGGDAGPSVHIAPSNTEGGCGCRLGSRGATGAWAFWAWSFGLLWLRRRAAQRGRATS